MKYYIRYKLITGLGQPEFEETFNTIAERYQHYRLIVGAGYEVVKFGTRGDDGRHT